MRHRHSTARRIGTAVVTLAALGAAGGTAMAVHPGDGAGAGGSTEQTSGGKAASVRVLTWNTCANTNPDVKLCPNGRNTDRVTSGIKWHMRQVDGLNAVFLQEICKADVDVLNKMKGWKWGFSQGADRGSGSSKGDIRPRKCVNGRKGFGVAVGVKADDVKFTEHRYATKNVPNARDHWKHWNSQQSAMCADALGTRFCSTHFTPWNGGHDPDHPRSEFLTSQHGQAEELAALGKGQKQVVLGGDLNSSPKRTFQYGGKTVDMLGSLYGGYKECSQDANGGERAGTGTHQWVDKKGKIHRGDKLDYLFTNKSAKASCPVTEKPVTLSDHVTVAAEITF